MPASGLYGQKNTVRTSLSGFMTGEFNVSYERMTYENQSVLLRIGYFQPTLSPVITENTITPSQYSFKDSRGTLQTSVDYRWYTKKQGLTGFYFGPYLRYYGLRVDYSDNINSGLFGVEGSLNAIGAGIQLGYNFIIKEMFSIDLSFFGAGIDRNSVRLIYTTSQPGFDYSTIVDDVSEVFEDIPYFEKKLKNQINRDNLTTRLPFLFPGLRASIHVGIAF